MKAAWSTPMVRVLARSSLGRKDTSSPDIAGGLLFAFLGLLLVLITNPEKSGNRYLPPDLEGIWAVRGPTTNSGFMTLSLIRDTLRPGGWVGYFEGNGFRLDVLGGYMPNTRNCWLTGSNSQFDYDFRITLPDGDQFFAGATVTVRERESTTTYYDGYFSGMRNNPRTPTAPWR
jgi:hypothetical protein